MERGELPPAGAGWDGVVFAGEDPEEAFWSETADCLSQFAGLFEVVDRTDEEVGKDNWGGDDYVHTLVLDSAGREVPTVERPMVRLVIKQAVMPQTAGVVWDGAVALSYFLEASPALVRGRRVLELGCGTALPSLVAAALGAQHVLLTEMDNPACLQIARTSVQNNAEALKAAGVRIEGVGAGSRLDDQTGAISVAPLDWRADLPQSVSAAQVDVLLASDVLGCTADSLDGDLSPTGPFHSLLRTLLAFARLPSPPRALLIAYKRRLKHRERPFFERLAQHFAISVVWAPPPAPSSTVAPSCGCDDADDAADDDERGGATAAPAADRREGADGEGVSDGCGGDRNQGWEGVRRRELSHCFVLSLTLRQQGVERTPAHTPS
jgi:SAM-dependent methyltransferase